MRRKWEDARKRRKIKPPPPSGKVSGFRHAFVTKGVSEFDGITKFTEFFEDESSEGNRNPYLPIHARILALIVIRLNFVSVIGQ
jgi:hypothetical protein